MQRPVLESLGATPTVEEVMQRIAEMKDSTGGKDEITIGALRAGGLRPLYLFAQIVVDLWTLPGSSWPQSLHDVLGVLLYKKGGRHLLANYRTIMLIQVVSRIIAKTAAHRIQNFAEATGLFPVTQ